MKTHYKKLMNLDYLGAYSIDEGKTLVLTIKEVKKEIVSGADGKKEECIVASFIEPSKSMILNSTNCKTIAKLYKSNFIEDWKGRKIELYVASVKAFGDVVDALRIKPSIPVVKNIVTKCADCGQDIKGYDKFTAEQIAQGSYNKYGKSLCTPCAQKAKEATVEAVNPFETTPPSPIKNVTEE